MKKSKHVLLLMLGLITLASCGNNSSSSSAPASSSAPITEVSSSEIPSSEVKPPVKYFTVTWMDESGKSLGTTSVEEGKIPAYSYSPKSDEKTTKALVGWALTLGGEVVSLSAVTKEVTYFAVISETPKQYKITFNTGSGTSVDPITVPYGTLVEAPDSPTLEGSRFVGWASDSAGEEKVSWPYTVTGNITFYAIYNAKLDLKAHLKTLTEGYKLNPYSYIPEAMRPDYAANIVKDSDLVEDYTSFVSTNKIKSGYGEQWNMVLENINQSMLFFNAISAVETIVSSSVVVFNDYLDKNPADFAEHEFTVGTYRVVVIFKDDVLTYVLNYELAGASTEIALSLNVNTGERVGRIQMGQANALRYVIREDSYTFAIRYFGIRRAYFHIKKVGDDLSGHIYETLGIDGKFSTVSAAEFFVIDDYLAVVGNKASRNLGSSNTISELYRKNTGKLVGYEIEEKYPLVTYHSVWFNLSDVEGISNIKIAKNEEEITQIFVNNQTTPFAYKTLGGINPLTNTSKRFNLETRDQYFNVYDAVNDTYTRKEVATPMLFVQEQSLKTLVADVKEKNSYLTSFALVISADDLANIIAHYKVLVPNFKEFKELMSAEQILDFIGSAIIVKPTE